MYATLEVYNTLTSPDEMVYTETLTGMVLDNFAVDADEGRAQKMYQMTIPAVAGCYLVKVTYGQEGKQSSTIVQNSDVTCWYPTCILDTPVLQVVSYTIPDDGNSIDWDLDFTYSFDEYCYSFETIGCITNTNSGIDYCTEIDNTSAIPGVLSTSGSIIVPQKGDFD